MAQFRAAGEPAFEPASGDLLVPAARLGDRLAERHLLRPERIEEILRLQRRWGCRFGDALIAEGVVTPFELAEALADGWGLNVVNLISDAPDESLSRAAHVDLYLAHLFLPWRKVGGVPVIACADPDDETRRLIAYLYGPDARIAMTGKFDIIWSVERIFRARLLHDATFRLYEERPEMSARRVTTRMQRAVGYLLTVVLGVSVLAKPDLGITLVLLLLSLCYGVNIALRLALFIAASRGRSTFQTVGESELASLDDASLPVYSIVVPLLREANMVARLAEALKALDYPAAKLDVKIVLEEGDDETLAAARSLHLDGRFEILVVPKGEPRTKPRACNYALRFARGEYLVIYDAEDRPEPDQLKKAAALFRAASPDVACYQARLNVYNADDNWLTNGLMAQTPQANHPTCT